MADHNQSTMASDAVRMPLCWVPVNSKKILHTLCTLDTADTASRVANNPCTIEGPALTTKAFASDP